MGSRSIIIAVQPGLVKLLYGTQHHDIGVKIQYPVKAFGEVLCGKYPKIHLTGISVGNGGVRKFVLPCLYVNEPAFIGRDTLTDSLKIRLGKRSVHNVNIKFRVGI